MSRRHRGCLSLGLVLVLVLAGCAQPGTPAAPTFALPLTPEALSGRTITISRADLALTVEARAWIAAQQEALLVFPLDGTLQTVNVLPGDQVSEGEIIAELYAIGAEQDLAEKRMAVERAEMALAQAKEKAQAFVAEAESKLALARLARTRAIAVAAAQLAKAQADVVVTEAALRQAQVIHINADDVSAAIINAAEMRVAQARDALAVVQANDPVARAGAELAVALASGEAVSTTQRQAVEVAELNLRHAQQRDLAAQEQYAGTVLLAPFDGIVISVESQPGDRVEAYEPIGAVADPSRLLVVATVFEDEMSTIAVGQPARVVLDAYPERHYTATVLQIATEAIVWQGKQAREVTLAFDEGQDVPATIRMGADVTFVGPTREGILVVPDGAILAIGDQRYVTLWEADGPGERIAIETGISSAGMTEVTSGLQEGDVIATP